MNIHPRSTSALLALLLAASPAAADEISLDEVVITEGQEEAVVEHVPWSGSWWAFQRGKLSYGYHGADSFTYDEASEDFTAVDKPDNDRSPLQKYDLFVERRTGANPGAAYLELKGDDDKDFHHHVYGERKRDLDDRGVSYSWWGHCNGWAAAACMEREPVGALEAEGIRFDVGDLKGILTESYWGVRSDFTGRRYNKPSDELKAKVEKGQELLDKLGGNEEPPVADYIAWYEDIYDRDLDPDVESRLTPENFRSSLEHVRDWAKENWEDAYEDIYPHVFHKILVTVIKNKRMALVFDTSANEEVWNFPAYHYSTQITFVEDTADGGKKYDVATTVYYAHDGVSESILGVNRLQEDYTYTLITDAQGRPTGGEWTGASVDNHPDFAWLPTYNPEGEDRGENPNVLYGEILKILAEDHAHAPRTFELAVTTPDGAVVKQSERIDAQETTTWSNPVEVNSPVALSVVRSGNGAPIASVKYFRGNVDAGYRFATVERGEMTLLGETTGNLAASYELAMGKHHLIAHGLNADGRLISESELTVQVVSGNPPPPPPPASDDAFEENDDRASAAAVAAGTHSGLRCADADWFKVTLNQGGRIQARIAFSNSQGDLDMKLYSGSQQLASSTSTSDSETVEKADLAAGDYLVHVYGYSNAEADYDLTLVIEESSTPPPPPPPASDDAFEPNDSRAEAALLSAGTHGIQVKNDDWFKVELQAGERATWTAAFSHSAGDIDIKAFGPDGTALGGSESTSDQEQVVVTANTAGSYTLRVFGYNGAQNDVQLTLAVEAGTPPPPASDDAFEANDTLAAATALQPGNYPSLKAAGNDDWFKVEVPAGQTVTLVISFDNGEGDLDMSLHGADGARLGVSQSTSNEERIAHTVTVTGPVFLRVFGYSGAQAGYTLDVQVQ